MLLTWDLLAHTNEAGALMLGVSLLMVPQTWLLLAAGRPVSGWCGLGRLTRLNTAP
jgi:hypothetical protein